MGASSRVQPVDIAPTNRLIKAWAQQDYSLKGPWSFRTKEKVQCLCEGARWCTREDPDKNKTGNAIPGLHCNWVGGKILAMARPWQENIVKFNLVDAFIKNNIGMILNLQEVGEHEHCGPGNLKQSGFSYDPETFMAANVGFYNFYWRDMGVPDLDRMMDIVQVMEYVTSVEQRRIAVHCHAGLGRTGLAIACFYVLTGEHSAQKAIEATRRDRSGALQTAKQVLFVRVFEQYLAHLRCLFSAAQPTQDRHLVDAGSWCSPTKVRTAISGVITGHGAGSAGTGAGNGTQSLLPPAKEVKESNGMQTLVYDSGLVVTRPVNGVKHSTSTSSNSNSFSDEELGLDKHLPWNEMFHIQPELFSAEWRPSPPRSYTEALRRQQRLLHGNERRAFLHLHKFPKEVVFHIIAAAQAHTAAAAAEQAGSPGGPSTSGRDHSSFAQLLEMCVTRQVGTAVPGAARDADVLPILAAMPGGERLVGAKADWGRTHQQVDELKAWVNSHRYQRLQSAPLMVLVMLLEDFFANCNACGQPSLSVAALRKIADVYLTLPIEVQHSPEPNQFLEATKVLAELPAQDHELLLLFSAMMRHVAHSSTQGSEPSLVALGRWVLRLLLGAKLSQDAGAQEAVLSFLWYLLRNDVAYASLILIKKQRVERRAHAGTMGSFVSRTQQPVPPPAANTAAPPSPPPAAGTAAAAGSHVPASHPHSSAAPQHPSLQPGAPPAADRSEDQTPQLPLPPPAPTPVGGAQMPTPSPPLSPLPYPHPLAKSASRNTSLAMLPPLRLTSSTTLPPLYTSLPPIGSLPASPVGQPPTSTQAPLPPHLPPSQTPGTLQHPAPAAPTQPAEDASASISPPTSVTTPATPSIPGSHQGIAPSGRMQAAGGLPPIRGAGGLSPLRAGQLPAIPTVVIPPPVAHNVVVHDVWK